MISEMAGGSEALGDRLIYSVGEAAAALGIGTTLVKKLIRTGELRSIKIGRRRLVARADLEMFVEHCRQVA